ncbi:hypothetical protein ACN3XK_64520 [Actinomadura welshii]
MAWEWVSPVATSTGTLVVGIAGIVATYKAGNRQQETALSVAKQQAEAQASAAREERQQRRLEEAYTDLLITLSHVDDWLHRVYPLITENKEQYTMPSMPEIPNRIEREAVLTAYWSPQIQRLHTDWRQAVAELRHTGMDIEYIQKQEELGRESGLNKAEILKSLPKQKEAVREADQAIRSQVRLELMGQSDGNL